MLLRQRGLAWRRWPLICGEIKPGKVDTDYSRQFINREAVGIQADTHNVSLRMEYQLADCLTLTAAARAGASFGAALANEIALCAANPICGSVIPFFGPSVPNARDENLLDIRNVAVFGAIAWHITPTINLGIEGRYAEEKVEQTAFDFDEGQARPAPVLSQQTYKEFTPRVTFDWQIAPEHLFYAIYAEGQKPGGFNGPLAIAAGVPTTRQRTTPPTSSGSRTSCSNGQLFANVAVFHNEINGYQLTQNVSVPPNQVSLVTNAGEARVNGLEVEFLARPHPDITVTANYALADSKITSGFDENQGVLNDVADEGLVNCSTGDQFPEIPNCQSLFGSIEGKRIPRAPKHRAFIDLDWRTPVTDGPWEVFAGGNVALTSKAYAQVHNLAFFGEAVEVDVRAGFQNDRFRVQAYVDNLTDEDSVLQVLRFADANLNLRRAFVGGLRPGRRVGIDLSANF